MFYILSRQAMIGELDYQLVLNYVLKTLKYDSDLNT